MIADRLKELRQQKALSQMALSKLLGVSQQTVGSWETGRTAPDVEMITTIARTFNVTTDYLLGNDTAAPSTVNITGDNAIINGAAINNGTINHTAAAPSAQTEICQMYRSLPEDARKRIDRMVKGEYEDAMARMKKEGK